MSITHRLTDHGTQSAQASTAPECGGGLSLRSFVRDTIAVPTDAPKIVRLAAPYPRLDLCRFRHMLEGQAARLAAMRVVDAHIDALERNLHSFRTQIRAMQLHEATETDFEFHSLIIAISGVRLFADLHASFRDMLIEVIRMPQASYSRAWEPVVEHERILEAFRRRDPEEARYYVQSHIVRSAERFGIVLAEDVV